MPEPTFTAREVCGAIGIPRGTLNHWAANGYLTGLGLEGVSAGGTRRYTAVAVLALALLRHLVDLGIPIENAADPEKNAVDWAKFAAMYYLDSDGRARQFNIYRTSAGLDAFPEQHERPAPADAHSRITIYPLAFLSEIKARLTGGQMQPRRRRKRNRQ